MSEHSSYAVQLYGEDRKLIKQIRLERLPLVGDELRIDDRRSDDPSRREVITYEVTGRAHNLLQLPTGFVHSYRLYVKAVNNEPHPTLAIANQLHAKYKQGLKAEEQAWRQAMEWQAKQREG